MKSQFIVVSLLFVTSTVAFAEVENPACRTFGDSEAFVCTPSGNATRGKKFPELVLNTSEYYGDKAEAYFYLTEGFVHDAEDAKRKYVPFVKASDTAFTNGKATFRNDNTHTLVEFTQTTCAGGTAVVIKDNVTYKLKCVVQDNGGCY